MFIVADSYKTWNCAQLVDWITSLDPSFEGAYRSSLTASFTARGTTGDALSSLDREDLLIEHGIVNLAHRRTIYRAIVKLVAAPKRRDSQILQNIASLSDDEEEAVDESSADYRMLLSEQQLDALQREGFCSLHKDDTQNPLLMQLVRGWMRQNHNGHGLIAEVIHAVAYYHGPKFDADTHVCLQTPDNTLLLTTRLNLSLSALFGAQSGDTLECTQVPGSTLRNVCRWLGHHKGVEPAPVPCPVRSVHMAQIVEDPWDAEWIDTFDKKSLFELIMAANYMSIKPLIHLAAAKVATLIKQLDQQEINRIIEEEESHRREQAQTAEAERFSDDEEEEDANSSASEVKGLDEDEEDEDQAQ